MAEARTPLTAHSQEKCNPVFDIVFGEVIENYPDDDDGVPWTFVTEPINTIADVYKIIKLGMVQNCREEDWPDAFMSYWQINNPDTLKRHYYGAHRKVQRMIEVCSEFQFIALCQAIRRQFKGLESSEDEPLVRDQLNKYFEDKNI